MTKAKKPPISPKDLRRLVEDGGRKGDLKSFGVLRVLSEAITYGRHVAIGKASVLEVEAFWQRLYLVLTEIETGHRALAANVARNHQSAPTHRGVAWMSEKAKPVIVVHDDLRSTLTDPELVLIDFRRHAASHVSVDAYRMHLKNGALIDGSKMTILGGRQLTVKEKDDLLEEARGALGDDYLGAAQGLAIRSVPILESLLDSARPLHSPIEWKYNRVHVVEDGDGNWLNIAGAAVVDLQELLTANGDPEATSEPTSGTIIIIPG